MFLPPPAKLLGERIIAALHDGGGGARGFRALFYGCDFQADVKAALARRCSSACGSCAFWERAGESDTKNDATLYRKPAGDGQRGRGTAHGLHLKLLLSEML